MAKSGGVSCGPLESEVVMSTLEKAKAARGASFKLASVSDKMKSRVIELVAELLKEKQDFVLAENQKDLEAARKDNISQVLAKRLVLDEKKIDGMIASLKDVAALADEHVDMLAGTLHLEPNGLRLARTGWGGQTEKSDEDKPEREDNKVKGNGRPLAHRWRFFSDVPVVGLAYELE